MHGAHGGWRPPRVEPERSGVELNKENAMNPKSGDVIFTRVAHPEHPAEVPGTIYQSIGKEKAGGFGKVFVVHKDAGRKGAEVKALKVYGYDESVAAQAKNAEQPFDAMLDEYDLWTGFFGRHFDRFEKAARQELAGIKKMKAPRPGFMAVSPEAEIIFVHQQDTHACRVYPALEMPWIEGGVSLTEVMGVRAMASREQAYAIFARLLDIMADFADEGYTHGDLSPNNVLVGKMFPIGDITIIDFQTLQDGDPIASRSMSRVNVATPGWSFDHATHGGMVPQPASDVYALGNILEALLRGARPIPGESTRDRQGHLQFGPPESVRRHRLGAAQPPVDAELIRLVADMTVQNLSRRPTMRQARDRFEAIHQRLQTRAPSRHGRTALTMLLGAAALLAVTFAFLSRPPSAQPLLPPPPSPDPLAQIPGLIVAGADTEGVLKEARPRRFPPPVKKPPPRQPRPRWPPCTKRRARATSPPSND